MADPSKSDTLSMIRQGLVDAENAIRSHPPATIAVYEQDLRAYREGQDQATELVELRALGVTFEDYKMAHRYLVAMAFVSAWYHRHGDKARRDKAAHSAATLVSAIGLDPEAVFSVFLNHENAWRAGLKQHSIGRSQGFGCAPIILLSLVLVASLRACASGDDLPSDRPLGELWPAAQKARYGACQRV